MIVGDGARAEFQGWEVRYEVGRSVTASRASGRKGCAGYGKGEMDILQNGEQIGTAWPPVRRQGSCRQPRREIRVSAAGAGIQGSREECGAGPVSLLRGSDEGTLEPGPRLGTWAHKLLPGAQA